MPGAVGFVGLGAMGATMAGHLLDWPGGLLVHDVRTEAAAPLVARGAAVAGSLAELAASAEVVSVMVVDDAQVRQVVDGLAAHARPGLVVAVHSTIRPGTAVALDLALRPLGVGFVDAPVTGGVLGAAAGRLAVLAGGDADAVDRCRPAFGSFAEIVTHVGPAGSGTRAKLARNIANFVGIAAALEAARVAEAAGIDLRELARVTTHSDALTGGPGAVLVRDGTGPLAASDPLRAVLEHTRRLGEKDLSLAVELAGELGVEVPLARVALERLGSYLGVAP